MFKLVGLPLVKQAWYGPEPRNKQSQDIPGGGVIGDGGVVFLGFCLIDLIPKMQTSWGHVHGWLVREGGNKAISAQLEMGRSWQYLASNSKKKFT